MPFVPRPEDLPDLKSPAFKEILELCDEMRGDGFAAARGIMAARTRTRVKLSKISNLCKQARKEISPVSKGH